MNKIELYEKTERDVQTVVVTIKGTPRETFNRYLSTLESLGYDVETMISRYLGDSK
jgi:hypothetical protein